MPIYTVSSAGTVGQSLNFGSKVMTLGTEASEIVLDVQDDDIALEDPEEVILQLSVPSQTSCSIVRAHPLKSTTILVFDDDGECNTLVTNVSRVPYYALACIIIVVCEVAVQL